MGLVSWIVVGAIAGVLARWNMPGTGPSGFLITIVLGMVGALVGGFVKSS